MTEAHRIPSHWAEHTKRVDEIWVPSRFLVDAFVSGGVPQSKLVVIPEAVHPSFFATALPQVYMRDNSSVRSSATYYFKFLSVGKWEARKGTVWHMPCGFASTECPCHIEWAVLRI
jgi:hypothetical protein